MSDLADLLLNTLFWVKSGTYGVDIRITVAVSARAVDVGGYSVCVEMLKPPTMFTCSKMLMSLSSLV